MRVMTRDEVRSDRRALRRAGMRLVRASRQKRDLAAVVVLVQTLAGGKKLHK